MTKQSSVVKTFLDLVKIESPSGKEKEIGEWIISYLKKLGVTAVTDSFGNIIAKIEGIKAPYFMVNAHIDTVQPCSQIKPVVNDGIISTEGDTILGADDKAGVAGILELVKILKENKIKHYPLEIVFTVQEELGTIGAQKLNFSLIDAKKGVTIDGEKINNIVLAAPYINNIDIVITGKSAHSGIEPERGVNALKAACDAIAKVKLGKIDKDTTANIGMINGGEIRNSVPAKVEIKAEVRSHNYAKMNRRIAKIKEIFEKEVKKYKAKMIFNSEIVCHGYKFQKGSSNIKKIADAMRAQGLRPNYHNSGGGSDANVFNYKNIKVVNIGTGARNVHTTSEKIATEDLNKIPQILLEMIKVV